MRSFSGKGHSDPEGLWREKLVTVNVLEDDEVPPGHQRIFQLAHHPQLYVAGGFGGSDIMNEMNDSGELKTLLEQSALYGLEVAHAATCCVIGITGATGALYAVRMLQTLRRGRCRDSPG